MFDLMMVLRNMSEEEKKTVVIKATGLSRNNPYFTIKDFEETQEKNTQINIHELQEDTVLLEDENIELLENEEDTELLEDDNTILLENDDNTVLLEEVNVCITEPNILTPKSNILLVGFLCVASYLIGLFVMNSFL